MIDPMMKKNLRLVLFMCMLAIAFVVACIMATAPVSSQKEVSKSKSLKALEKKADSIMKAIDDKYRQYEIKIDSLHKSRYIESLEKANEIQSGNNTYFSLLIGFVAICVTVFGVNYFNTVRHKRYTALLEENTRAMKMPAVNEKPRSADERLDRLEKKYEGLWKRFELHLSLLEESLVSLRSVKSQLARTPALYIECEACGKEFDPMKNFKELRPGRTGKQAILTKCTFCGKKKFLDIPNNRKN